MVPPIPSLSFKGVALNKTVANGVPKSVKAPSAAKKPGKKPEKKPGKKNVKKGDRKPKPKKAAGGAKKLAALKIPKVKKNVKVPKLKKAVKPAKAKPIIKK
ncbi:unnamed protein product [Phytomonas sp. Hart1]|nr:unnamed protein product [Phytomonas sp. Hart1]|eukprot:CCW69369.1 unnamed protein product [Phytomonas sp. isolate Hart1]